MIAIELERAFYGKTDVLRNLSLKVEPGEFIVLLSANGGGKSTLLRCLAGLHEQMSGTCTLDGRRLCDCSLKDRAERISYLPQSVTPGFSFRAEEVILLSRYRYGHGDGREEDARRLHEVAEVMEVDGLLTRRVDELSGGEWQRVAVARTLMQDASMLFLDEPTAHLDLGHRLSLFRHCRSLVQNGKGVLCATHDLDAALEYADRVVVLHEGRIDCDGPVEKIMTSDLLERVYGSAPVEIMDHPFSGRPQLVIHSNQDVRRRQEKA